MNIRRTYQKWHVSYGNFIEFIAIIQNHHFFIFLIIFFKHYFKIFYFFKQYLMINYDKLFIILNKEIILNILYSWRNIRW